MASDTSSKEIKLDANQYAVDYRCPNCGVLMTKAVQKGTVALGKGGHCPNCGVKDGTPSVGNFQVIKKNPSYDQVRSYN